MPLPMSRSPMIGYFRHTAIVCIAIALAAFMTYYDLFVWTDQRFFFHLGSRHFVEKVRLRLWLALGRDPNGMWQEQTPLTHMAFKPWASAPIDVMQMLLAAGADPNRRDGRGQLPLVSMMAWSDYDRARLLLEHGADPNLTVAGGYSAVTGIFSTLPAERVEDYVHLFLAHGLDPCFVVERGRSEKKVVAPSSPWEGFERPSDDTRPRRTDDEYIWLPLSLDAYLARRGYPALAEEVRALCAAKTGAASPVPIR